MSIMGIPTSQEDLEVEPTLIEKLRDHKFNDSSTLPEQKVLRNEAAAQIEDMREAILIYIDENPPNLEEHMGFFGSEEEQEILKDYIDKGLFKAEFQEGPFGSADDMKIAWFVWYNRSLQPDVGKSTFESPWT